MGLRVPGSGIQKVRQSPEPNVRQNVNAPIESFGGGQANVGNALSEVASTGAKIALVEQEKANNLANKTFKNGFDEFHVAQYGPGGAFTSKGLNAVLDAPEELKKNFDKRKNELMEKAANDQQRAYINQQAEESWTLINKQMLVHAQNEQSEYDKAQTAASVKLNNDLAIQSYNDPAVVRKAIVSQIQAISSYGHAQGYAPEQIENLINEKISGTSTDVVSRYVSNNNILGGRAFFEKNKGLFHGDDVAKVEKMLKEGGSTEQANKYADDIVKEFNDVGAAIQAAKERIPDPDVQEKAITRIKVGMKDKNETPLKLYDSRLMEVIKQVDATGNASPALMAGLLPQGKTAVNDYILFKNGAKQVKRDNSAYLHYSEMSMAEMSKVPESELILEAKTNMTSDQFKSVSEKWQISREGLNGDPNAQKKYDATSEDRMNQLAALKEAGVMSDADTASTINKDSRKRKILLNYEAAVSADIQRKMDLNGGKPISEADRKQSYNDVLKRVVKIEGSLFNSDFDIPAVQVTEKNIDRVIITDKEKAVMLNAARANGVISPNMSDAQAEKYLKKNMQRAKVYAAQNGPYDTDLKKAQLIQILRGSE